MKQALVFSVHEPIEEFRWLAANLPSRRVVIDPWVWNDDLILISGVIYARTEQVVQDWLDWANEVNRLWPSTKKAR